MLGNMDLFVAYVTTRYADVDNLRHASCVILVGPV